jgi:hypothetical protein
MRATAEKLEARLVSNLDAATGEQRNTSAKVCQFGALAEVQLRARRAQLIVEVVDDGVFLLAHVAVQRLDGLAFLAILVNVLGGERLGWKHVRRREHGTPA